MRVCGCFLIFACFCVATIKCQSSSCTTPNGEKASCVSLLKCQILLQAAASNEPIVKKFFNESVCDENTSMVCCGTYGNFTKNTKPPKGSEQFTSLSKEEKRAYVLKRVLPSKTYCGMQHTDDYFYNDTQTSVDEFPWLVYMMQSDIEDRNFYLRVEDNCVGVLISAQYVLSTKKCRLYAQFNPTNPVEMLLGVHHIYKKVSCIGTPFGIDDCTNPPLRVTSSEWKHYEKVALLRLDKKIEFSDYVRPICLPLEDDEIPKTESTVIVSGWGEEQFVKGKSVKLKKRMKYTVISKNECENSNPIKNPICGAPLENNTQYICPSDNGGPLMYRHRQTNWFVAGIVSQIENECDGNQPVTALRLTPEILNWIIESVEPA